MGRRPKLKTVELPRQKYPEACVWQPTSNLLVIWVFFVEYTFIGIWVRRVVGVVVGNRVRRDEPRVAREHLKEANEDYQFHVHKLHLGLPYPSRRAAGGPSGASLESSSCLCVLHLSLHETHAKKVYQHIPTSPPRGSRPGSLDQAGWL